MTPCVGVLINDARTQQQMVVLSRSSFPSFCLSPRSAEQIQTVHRSKRVIFLRGSAYPSKEISVSLTMIVQGTSIVSQVLVFQVVEHVRIMPGVRGDLIAGVVFVTGASVNRIMIVRQGRLAIRSSSSVGQPMHKIVHKQGVPLDRFVTRPRSNVGPVKIVLRRVVLLVKRATPPPACVSLRAPKIAPRELVPLDRSATPQQSDVRLLVPTVLRIPVAFHPMVLVGVADV